MQQRVCNPLTEIAQLPSCRKLAQARARLEELRQSEQVATGALRAEWRRVADRGSILLDSQAQKIEAEAIKATAAARLAAGEVEAAKRAHGETLASHLLKHGPVCLERLVEALEEAHASARQIADVCDRAAWDGAPIPHALGKVRRIAAETQDAVARLKR